jgi:hypothetical protein
VACAVPDLAGLFTALAGTFTFERPIALAGNPLARPGVPTGPPGARVNPAGRPPGRFACQVLELIRPRLALMLL